MVIVRIGLTCNKVNSETYIFSEDSELDDDIEDDDDDQDDEEQVVEARMLTSRSTASRPRSSRTARTINGKKAINMTPPNRLLEKALKMARKFSESKKVNYMHNLYPQ